MQQTIQQTLRSLGITANYRGYHQLCYIVELVAQDEDCLLNMNQRVYIPVAASFHCNPNTLERNIRTLISRVWEVNPNRLSEIAGYQLEWPPTVTEFIDYVTNYVRCSCCARS